MSGCSTVHNITCAVTVVDVNADVGSLPDLSNLQTKHNDKHETWKVKAASSPSTVLVVWAPVMGWFSTVMVRVVVVDPMELAAVTTTVYTPALSYVCICELVVVETVGLPSPKSKM